MSNPRREKALPKPDGTVPPGRRRTLTTDRVVAAAAELADREGFDALTLTRVAEDLGVQQPALYRHIEGIDDLVRLLGLYGRQELVRRLTDSSVGKSGNDAVAALGNAWRQMVRDHPGLYAATDRYPCKGDAELEEAVDRVVGVLRQALSSFQLTDDQRVHVARSLRSAFHGFSHLELGDGHPTAVDVEDSFHHLVELLCTGIAALERSASRTAP